MDVLPTCPPMLLRAGGELRSGLFAGRIPVAPAEALPRRRRRLRRWSYAAAAGDGLALGAAVIDLGYVGAAFAWALTDDGLFTWAGRRPLGLGCSVGRLPGSAWWRSSAAHIDIGEAGGLRADVPTSAGRITIELDARSGDPVTLVTDTGGGGWNVTEKEAGYAVDGAVSVAGSRHAFRGSGWRDWTVGRQDRHTSWMWAAAAGVAGDHRVGLNVSTGMNRHGPGEDVVWWNGRPFPLAVDRFTRGERVWQLAGPGWSLDFSPRGERAATERLGPVRSSYIQPIGSFSGTLPGPSGEVIELTAVPGVTEAHEARW